MVNDKITGLIYLILLSVTGFINSENVIDVVGIQWYYLSYLNIFFLGFTLLKRLIQNRKENNISFFSNPLIILYLIFFLFCSLSLSFSINHSVSIIALSKLSITLISLFLFEELQIFKNFNINQLSILFSTYLLIEVFLSIKPFFEIIQVTDYDFSMADQFLRGAAANKNITSASIAFKIPFIYFLIFKYKNIFLRILLLIICTTAFFNLIILSSRAIILSVTIFSFFYFTGSIISSLISNYNSKSILKNLFIFFIPIVMALGISNTLFKNESTNIGNRISSINSDDVSSSTRFRYYTKGSNYALKNPFLGVGIGNWQLISIKLDSDSLESYIVPYVAHNDFIELATEIGILGAIIYLIFILSSLYFLAKMFFYKKIEYNHNAILILAIPGIIYFIDANLNFPLYRPIMLVNILFYSTFIYGLYKHQNLKNLK